MFSKFDGPNAFFPKFNRPLARLQKGRKIPESVAQYPSLIRKTMHRPLDKSA